MRAHAAQAKERGRCFDQQQKASEGTPGQEEKQKKKERKCREMALAHSRVTRYGAYQAETAQQQGMW